MTQQATTITTTTLQQLQHTTTHNYNTHTLWQNESDFKMKENVERNLKEKYRKMVTEVQ